MAGSIRIKINPKGVRALLRSPEVLAALEQRAERIAESAGGSPDFIVQTDVGKNRARAAVITATADAQRAEATDRTLTRALDAGRG